VLTFSDRVLYPVYAFQSRAAEAAALNDQVLAGVIMWVPMSLAYLIPAALLTIRLLSPERRQWANAKGTAHPLCIRSLSARAYAGAICRSSGMARISRKR
jgi:cytochrome c oxidase assembly factor CtaG